MAVMSVNLHLNGETKLRCEAEPLGEDPSEETEVLRLGDSLQDATFFLAPGHVPQIESALAESRYSSQGHVWQAALAIHKGHPARALLSPPPLNGASEPALPGPSEGAYECTQCSSLTTFASGLCAACRAPAMNDRLEARPQ